jgi:hypothetical protein
VLLPEADVGTGGYYCPRSPIIEKVFLVAILNEVCGRFFPVPFPPKGATPAADS